MVRVLVVERVASMREAVALVLETQGHLVAAAGTAEEALACAVVWRPHVIVVDADVDGLPLSAFCTALRAAASSVAIVVTSLRPASCTDVAACPNATFLPKPFTPAELDRLVAGEVLRQERTASPGCLGIA